MAERTIAFGYQDIGALTIVIKRADGTKYWTGSGWSSTAPSPALDMTYDSDINQYYSEEAPTSHAYWSAYSGVNAIMAGEVLGGPTIVTPPSASSYTNVEILSRVRIEIGDEDSDRFTDAKLLNLLDKATGWLSNEAFKTKSAFGVSEATYSGDGTTTAWGFPSDWRGWKAFFNDDIYTGGILDSVPKIIYERGLLALEAGDLVVAWTMDGQYVYFIKDPLADGKDIVAQYYARPAKALSTDGIPFDGVFIDLMVQWVVVMILNLDEYDTKVEQAVLTVFMKDATTFFSSHRDWPQEIDVPKSRYVNAHQKQTRSSRIRHRR